MKNKTRLKFVGSAVLLLSTLGVLMAVLGQLNFIGNARPEPVALKKQDKTNKNKPKYSFYDELKKRKTEVDNHKPRAKEQTTRNNQTKNTNTYRYVVQVGAFSKEADANRTKQKLLDLGYPARVVKGRRKYLAQVGPLDGKSKAYQTEKQLKSKKYPTLVKRLK